MTKTAAPATPAIPQAFSDKTMRWIAAGLSLLAIGMAVFVWGQFVRWRLVGISTYLLFPVFGLVAFSTMWSQYAAGTIRRLVGAPPAALKGYFAATGYLVLLCILLHPGLLIWQLWRDGAGLPPHSDLTYVAPALRAFVVLGLINLTILLLFELRRWFSNKPWWKPFPYVVDLVMFSIFIHGLKLGDQLQMGWFRGVWFFYGASLVAMLAYTYWQRWQGQGPARPGAILKK